MGNIILPANSGKTLRSAADCILQGGIIAYPTETVYGLGARYDDEQALERLYRLKRRPEDKTMPLIIGDVASLNLLAEFVTDPARILISTYWPGPLTLIFRARKGLSGFITRDSGIALRMPGESFALDLVRTVGMPITSTSANISGMPPAHNALSAAEYFGHDIDMIVDGGESPAEKPSTIVDVTQEEVRILRKGPISLSDIVSSIKKKLK
jgi:L-threonylcarbamoyladenylate synthase